MIKIFQIPLAFLFQNLALLFNLQRWFTILQSSETFQEPSPSVLLDEINKSEMDNRQQEEPDIMKRISKSGKFKEAPEL